MKICNSPATKFSILWRILIGFRAKNALKWRSMTGKINIRGLTHGKCDSPFHIYLVPNSLSPASPRPGTIYL